MILTLKTIICWNLLEKFRDAFLCGKKSIKPDIYAVRYALKTGNRVKTRKYLAVHFVQNRSDCHYGTVRANAIF